jgi:hypothetical protein
MEIRNIHEDSGWYASYERSEQGVALIRCQELKIKQLSDLIKTISGEIELCENPKEFNPETVVASIKALIEKIPEVSFTNGYFKWVG